MKKSEFTHMFSKSIEGMFQSVSDTTRVGEMFSESDSPEWNLEDFYNFLKSSYLNDFKKIYDKCFQSDGSRINKELFFNEAAKDILEFFNENNIRKEKTFEQCFPYKDIHEPGYFDALSEVIVNRLEYFGKPPLFHKRQDKVLRYDWERED